MYCCVVSYLMQCGCKQFSINIHISTTVNLLHGICGIVIKINCKPLVWAKKYVDIATNVQLRYVSVILTL